MPQPDRRIVDKAHVRQRIHAVVCHPGSTTRFRTGIVVFCAALVYLSLFAGVWQRIGDEGTIVNGPPESPTVQFHTAISRTWPTAFVLLVGGWFAVFGTDLAVARVLLVLTGACSAGLIFWLAARAYGTRTGVTAAVLGTVLGIPYWPGTTTTGTRICSFWSPFHASRSGNRDRAGRSRCLQESRRHSPPASW